MPANVFTIEAIKLLGGAPFVIDQISQIGMDPKVSKIIASASGIIVPQWGGVRRVEPSVTMTTTALKKVLDVVGLTEISIGEVGDTYTGAELWYKKRKQGARYDSTSVWVRATIAQGILVVRTIQGGGEDDVTVELELVVGHDGSGNDPIVITTSLADPGLTPDITELYGIGPLVVEGTKDEHVTTINYDSGITIDSVTPSNGIFPTHLSVKEALPKLTIGVLDLAHIKTVSPGVGIAGRAIGSSVDVYFAKRAAGAGFQADASAVHTKIEVNEGQMSFSGMDVGHLDNAGPSIDIDMVYDGTNAIAVLNTAIAIP